MTFGRWFAAVAVVLTAGLAAISFWVSAGAIVVLALIAARRPISAAIGRAFHVVNPSRPTARLKDTLLPLAVYGSVFVLMLFAVGSLTMAGSIKINFVPESFTPFKNYNVEVMPANGALDSFDITVTMDYDPSLSARGAVPGVSAQPVKLPTQRINASSGKGFLVRAVTIAAPTNLRVQLVTDTGAAVETPVCRSTCPAMTIELKQFPDGAILAPLSGYQQSTSSISEYQSEVFLVPAQDTLQDVSVEFLPKPWLYMRKEIGPLIGLHSLGRALGLVVGGVIVVIAVVVKKILDIVLQPLYAKLAARLHPPHEDAKQT